MSAAAETFPPPSRIGWLPWLRRELAPAPGRVRTTLSIVLAAVIVTVISMTLEVPVTFLSVYMVLFVTKESRSLTMLAGIVLLLGVTLGVGLSLFVFRWTIDAPELRVPAMAAMVFGAMFLSRTFVIGPLGWAIGFIAAYTQSVADSVPDAEVMVRAMLWLLPVFSLPVVVNIVISRLFLPDTPAEAPGERKEPRRVFAADAFTNPVYTRFALKVTFAAMSCYVVYSGLDWAGIHTAFITCVIIALESTHATMNKGWLRISGAAVGGSLGFLAIMYLVPHMETIVSLALLTAVGTALAGWVAAGSERIAYAGLQIGLAFYMCIFQGFAPATGFETIRDRIVGIIFGLAVTSVVFQYIWPEPDAEQA